MTKQPAITDMTADTVTRALSYRHADDVFVPEVKAGSSHMMKNVERYEQIRSRLEEMGFDPELPYRFWSIRKIDNSLRSEVDEAQVKVQRAKEQLERAENVLAGKDITMPLRKAKG